MRFIRKNGHIIPIRDKNPGGQPGKKVAGVKKPGIVPHKQKVSFKPEKPYAEQFGLGAATAATIGLTAHKGGKLAMAGLGVGLGLAGVGAYKQIAGSYRQGKKKGVASGVGRFVLTGLSYSAGSATAAHFGGKISRALKYAKKGF